MYAILEDQRIKIGTFANIVGKVIARPIKLSDSLKVLEQEVEIKRSLDNPEFKWTRHSYETVIRQLFVITQLLEKLIVGLYVCAVVSFLVGCSWLYIKYYT